MILSGNVVLNSKSKLSRDENPILVLIKIGIKTIGFGIGLNLVGVSPR
jgi:hypothetical protein